MVFSNSADLYANVARIFISILQVMANAVILFVWMKRRELRSNDNLILLFSLAVVDFLYALEEIPYLTILIVGSKPKGILVDYDPYAVIWIRGPSAALMKSGCTITAAIALDRVIALYHPVYYFQRNKRRWSLFWFAFALVLAGVDWLICILLVPIKRHPGAASFGEFVNHSFRVWWGLSNMTVNLLACILTLVIIYNLVSRSNHFAQLVNAERTNKAKVDRQANRVAFYILLVSALIGVIPSLLNGIGHSIELSMLDEISCLVDICAALSGLSHAFIFGMAHRDIREAIMEEFSCCQCCLPKNRKLIIKPENSQKRYVST